jgi:hypothetical protein
MTVREVTVYVVSCDWPGCQRDSTDVNPNDGAPLTQGEALIDWVSNDAVDATNGKQYCDEHAALVCVECGRTESLTEGIDRWFRCPEHHARDAS